MISIIEALTWGEQTLKKTAHEKCTGGHSAKLDAQVLLGTCLHKPTAYLFSHAGDEIPQHIFDTYERFIRRRARHEPIAYILGEQPFLGRSFFVNSSVLIPRPETELLAQYAIDLATPQSMLCDIGTGSGAIAISFSGETNLPSLGCEISPLALRVAKQNAKQHKLDHLVSFLQGHLLQPLLTHLPKKEHHLILTANLPYLPTKRKTTIDPDIYYFEPHLALFSGIDGLDLYHELCSQISDARRALPKHIHLLIEIDPSQVSSACTLLQSLFPNTHIDVLKDLAQKPRIIYAQI